MNLLQKKFKMKKKILSILPLMLFTAILVNAQTPEPTTYRGAFAPAPVAQWTDNWTNWNPQATPYGTGLPVAAKAGVLGNFATPSTINWVKDSVYLLQGIVYLDSLCTLIIEPGTIIKGASFSDGFTASSLVIQRGATLLANGTPCNPIVFTSNKPANSRTAGDWGGVAICGRAATNQGANVNLEGIGTTEPRARYGGIIPGDNSGSLKYVRIEFAGYVLSANNELNSLTMGGVGSGTTIDYVQTSFGNDDAFEWFGGSVNCKHLIAYRTLDDDFDTDFGYSGLVQFGLGIKDPNISDVTAVSTSEGFESDNNNFNSPNFGGTPITNAKFYNITQIGAYRCGNNTGVGLGAITNPTAPGNGHRRGARIRRNSAISIFNSILMNNFNGLFIENAPTQANYTSGALQFKNNIIAMDSTFNSTVTGATGLCKPGQDAFATAAAYLITNTNTILNTPCDLLTNAWSFLNPDFRPNGAGSGAALSGSDLAPGIQIQTGLFTANQAAEVVVDLFENGVGNSNGTITVTIPVNAISGWTIGLLGGQPITGVAGTAFGASAGNGGAPYDNRNWIFSISGGNFTATSIVGFSIPQSGSASIGLTVTRKGATPNGTNQSLSVNVGGGGDTDGTNNGALTGLGAIQ
jgi:hypothetical protein